METWYLLEDGTACDPRDAVSEADGTLRHRDGRAMAYGLHGVRSRSMSAAEIAAARAPAATATEDAAASAPATTATEDEGYSTRETRARK